MRTFQSRGDAGPVQIEGKIGGMAKYPEPQEIHVADLVCYPIKGCGGYRLDRSFIERAGLRDDRRMMVVTPEGRFLTQREHPRLALVTPRLGDGSVSLTAPDFQSITISIQMTGFPCYVDIWNSKRVPSLDQGQEAAAWFSDWLGANVRLVHIAEGYQRRVNQKYAVNPDDHTGYADGYPILMLSEESLGDLNARLEMPLMMDRFRPNLVVKGCAPFDEDRWKRIRIAGIELAVVKPCGRCEVTTFDKKTLNRSKEPLKTLATFRRHALGVIFGQNVIPLNEGTIETQMGVEVLQ